MAKAAIIRTSGLVEWVEFPEDNSLSTLQDAVGGWVERVPLPPHFQLSLDIWVNEEGLFMGLPYNSSATHLYNHYWQSSDLIIVGDVIVTGKDLPNGDTAGMSDADIVLFTEILNSVPSLDGSL